MIYCTSIPCHIMVKKYHPKNDRQIAETIIIGACIFFGVTREQLNGPSRKRHIKEARHMAQTLICRKTGLTLKSNGALFGGRDHTTVLHAKSVVSDLCDTDVNFKTQFERFSELIGSP